MSVPLVASDPVATLAGFTRALRASGVAADMSRLTSAVEALAQVDTSNVTDVYWVGRLTLCSGPDDIARYDQLFEEWFGPGRPLPHGRLPPPYERLPRVHGPARASTTETEGARDELGTAASDAEILRRRDVAELDEAQRDETNALIAMLEPRVGARRSHRRRPGRRGHVDPHRTVRVMLRGGGELRGLAWRRPQERPRRLVVLVDISGSMSPYADLMLRFAHAAVRASPTNTEVFTLGTSLTRITRQLSIRDSRQALLSAAEAISDWSGGTRLGETLRAFLDLWGQRGVARQAVVVIASDGWERGDAALLAEQMARLARLAHRVVWVNPHRGREGFAPLAAGMAAALPHLDDLLAGHTLDALQSLAEVIARA